MVATLAKQKPKLKQKGGNKPAKSGFVPSPTVLTPMAGETQLQFFERASRALRQQIPSVNRRTLEILKIWCASANDKDLRDKAAAMFPAAKYEHFGPRCIFLEHTVPGVPASADGERQEQPEIKYGQKEFQQLVDWANYRIRNSDNFAAISDGHTPSQSERAAGSPDPEVLGYSGPFYLGLFGDLDPVWAIYADEWVHLADVPRFEKLQRRSPEVWANEPIEARTMDPIAALGSATPKLDSGMNTYSRATDGRVVMKYSAMAFPGANNVSIPSAETRIKSTGLSKSSDSTIKYSGDSPMPPVPGQDNGETSLADKVGAALQNLLPSLVQAVVSQIEGEVPDDNVNDVDGADVDGADDSTPAPRGMDAPADDNTPADTSLAQDDTPADDPEAKKYKAMGPQCYEAYMAGRRGATKYSRGSNDANAGVTNLAGVVAKQANRIKALETDIKRERTDAVKYARLGELSREFAFDPKEEFETCSDMNEQQFARHCTVTIAKYARRDDLTGLELPDDLEPDRYSRGSATARVNPDQIERYSREAAMSAAHKNAAKKGATTFEAEFAAICQKNGVSL